MKRVHPYQKIVNLVTLSMLLGACGAARMESTNPPFPTPTEISTLAPVATAISAPTATVEPTATFEPLPDDWMSLQDPINWLVWSADGKSLAASANSGMYIFDMQADSAARTLENSQGVFYPLVLDGQSRRLQVANRVWDVATGKLLYQLATETAYRTVFSPDGKMLVVGEGNSITLWDAATGKFQKSLGEGRGSLEGLFFGADGSGPYAVYADHKIMQIDLASGKFTETGSSLPEAGCCTLLSPDKKKIFIAFPEHGAGHKEVWNVESKKVLINAEHCDNDVSLSAFSADSRYFVTGPCRFDTQLWDIQAGKMIHAFSYQNVHPEWRSGAFSPDGSQLALGNDLGKILIWDLTSYRLIKTLTIPKR